MPRSSRHHPSTFWEWFDQNVRYIFVALTAIGAAALVMIAMNSAPRVEAGTVAGPIPTFSSSTKASSTSPTDALDRLSDQAAPWNLAVIGDSTGNGTDEWVYLTAARLSAKYDRPVVIHDWSELKNVYVGENTVGKGAGAPIVIWNGSASGMNGQYSLKYLSTMVPVRPDFVIISHGHNLNADAAVPQVSALIAKMSTAWDTEPAFAVTLQNPRLDARADIQAGLVEDLKKRYLGTTVGLIDVYAAYQSASDVESLVRPDHFHPSAKGEILWATVVEKFLGI